MSLVSPEPFAEPRPLEELNINSWPPPSVQGPGGTMLHFLLLLSPGDSLTPPPCQEVFDLDGEVRRWNNDTSAVLNVPLEMSS